MKILAGIGSNIEEPGEVRENDINGANGNEEVEVGDDGVAVLWVVEPRSLAEQMRSDVVNAGEGVNA
jgi:hypothetical protein